MADSEDLYPFACGPSKDRAGHATAGTLSPDCHDRLRSFVRRMEKEVVDIEQQVAELHERKQELSQSITYHRQILVRMAVEQLPTEILAGIFLYCLDTAPSFDSLGSHYINPFSVGGPPWTLSYVCHQWRMAALSLPALWCQVALCGRIEDYDASIDNEDDPPWGSIYLLQLCLERSQNMPLRLRFEATCGEDRDRWTMVRTLFQHAEHFNVLEIKTTSEDIRDPTSRSHPFSQLKALHFISDYDAPLWLVNALRNATTLMTLKTAPFPTESLHNLGIICPNLTSLTFGEEYQLCGTHSALIVLAALPSLEVAELWLEEAEETSTLPAPDIVTSKTLTSLALAGDQLAAQSFLSKLFLPSLARMTMLTGDHDSSCIIMAVDRSSCNLTVLNIEMRTLDQCLSLTSLLITVPKLETLAIEMHSPTCILPTIDILPAQSENDMLCRHMQNLQVIWSDNHLLEAGGALLLQHLSSVVRSRVATVGLQAALQVVKIRIRAWAGGVLLSGLSWETAGEDGRLWTMLCDQFSLPSLVELWQACCRFHESTSGNAVKLIVEVVANSGDKWSMRLDPITSPADMPPSFKFIKNSPLEYVPLGHLDFT